MNKNPEKFAIEYLIRNGFKLEEDYNNFARQVVKIAIETLAKEHFPESFVALGKK